MSRDDVIGKAWAYINRGIVVKKADKKSETRQSVSADKVDSLAVAEEEFELKLDVDPSAVDALLALPPLNDANAKDRQQNSVYFDTPSRSLRDAGFSLRVRTIGERRVQTVKATGAAAAGLFVRPEWEHDIDSETPILLGGETPLRGLIPDAELKRIEPVFSVEVIRKTVVVDHGDALIEVVLDRGKIISDQHSSPVHELEFELKRGNPAALFRLAHDLDQSAPLRLGVLTKSDRGYMLGSADAGKPVKTAPLALQPGTTVRQGFQAIVGACLRQFRLNEAILLSTGDPDALHQARVSLRRLRSALSTFKPIVQDERFDQIRGELRWIAAELGHARNLDVLLARIDDRKAAPPLEEAHDRAYHAVNEALHSARLRRLMLEITEWLAIGQWATSPAGAEVREQPLEIYAAKVLGKHRRRLKRLGRDLANVTDERRHETRIEAKKLRYATEFFGSLFIADKAVKRLSAFHKRLASLQSYLGDLNDIATAPLVLAELGLVGTPTEAALQPDLSRRKPLIAKAARAHEELMDAKRFW